MDGISAGPFSPKGAHTTSCRSVLRCGQKVVCTFDCERKYIKYSETYTDIYYYALHGSGRQSLPRFIEQRWRVRDGVLSDRRLQGCKPRPRRSYRSQDRGGYPLPCRKVGYYGIGNDGGNVTRDVSQSWRRRRFTDFQHGDNILLYIYQADQMSEIDLSQISIDPNFQFSQMKLAEKIVIGSDTHKDLWRLSPGNTGFSQI